MGDGIYITHYILRSLPLAHFSAGGENQEPNPLANIDATWARGRGLAPLGWISFLPSKVTAFDGARDRYSSSAGRACHLALKCHKIGIKNPLNNIEFGFS